MTPIPPGRRARAPIAALLAADGISEIGNELTALAIPWLVLRSTGSAAQTGLVVAVGTAAGLVGGTFGGALVDRLGHKRASVIADVASALSVALIPLLQSTLGLAFWQLLLLVFAGALLDTPGRAARQSLFPNLARRAAVRLDRANATQQITVRTAGLVGPPLAGLLIAALGPTRVLWLDAATFLVSAGLVAVAVPGVGSARPALTDAPVPPSGYGRGIGEGLRFIGRDRLILSLAVGFALGNLLAEPIYGVVLPVYANDVLGSAVDLGLIFAALAAGSLLGNALFLAFAPRLPRRTLIVAGFAVRAAAFWVLVAMPPLPVIAGAIFLAAVVLEPTNPVWITIRQERVPERMRGRVFGALAALGSGSRALGIVAYGLLLDGIGLRATLLVLAAVNVLVPLALWLAPALKRMDSAQNIPPARREAFSSHDPTTPP